MSARETTAVAALATGIRNGERPALAGALNLLDDQRDAARELAAGLLALLQSEPAEAGAHLVGITGPPGVGKSTLGGALIKTWRQRGARVGVLAVDPASPVSGGALLGDRLRMHTDGTDDGVFIRSLSSRGHFGGLSAEVWPMTLVMKAAFDIVLIETVGVGQREIDIARLCDTTCFVAQPGSGDSIQALKAGILEVPHILVVNKSDMGAVAERTRTELASALCGEHRDGHWQVPVVATSATRGEGVPELADKIAQHYQALGTTLAGRRRGYQAYWLLCRLRDEFGEHGIARLGGEEALTAQLRAHYTSLIEQHETLRRRLLDGVN